MDQPLFIAIAGAAVATIMVVIAAAGWLLGLELGPLATWLSGAASATAVVVALRGHRLVADQRAQDRNEQREAAAHQITLKVTRLLERIAVLRRSYRVDARFITYERESGDMRLRTRAPIRRTLALDPFTLSEEQENLLVAIGALGELRGFERALSRVRNVTEMIGHHLETWQELVLIAPDHPIVLGAKTIDRITDRQPDVERNLVRQAALINVISEQLTEVGRDALTLAGPMERVLTDHAVAAASSIDAGPLAAELAEPIPPDTQRAASA